MKPRFFILTKVYGMNISPLARIALGARLDKTNPKGIYIGPESYVATGAVILSHGGGNYKKTYIGEKCLIGVNAIVLQGIKISDSVVVGAGSVVTKDIPPNCAVAGNPAKIIRKNIETKKYGRFISKGVRV
jgi:acetyltransferase-like isoleucine patch superfamily enzyme